MPGHTIEVMLDDQRIITLVKCHEPNGAQCRRACTYGCEEYCADPAGHIKPVDFCLAADSINAPSGLLDRHAGHGNSPLSNAATIDVCWDGYGEAWVWKLTGSRWTWEVAADLEATRQAVT